MKYYTFKHEEYFIIFGLTFVFFQKVLYDS